MKYREIEKHIAELEKDVQNSIAKRQELEEQLTAVYEAGGDDSKLLSSIGDIKTSIAAKISALRNLDKKLFDVQTVEAETLSREFEEKERQAYSDVMKAVVKNIDGPLKKSLSGTIPKNDIPALMESAVKVISDEVWKAIDADYSERWNENTVRPPSPVQQRSDETGEKMPILVDAFGLEKVR